MGSGQRYAARSLTLTFHGVGNHEVDDLYWLTTARFERVLDLVSSDPRISCTFDDGHLSDIDVALPCLSDRGLSATFFVVSGFIGLPGRLAKTHLRLLSDHGMEIGTHGMRHREWRRLNPIAARQEFVDARRDIELAIGRPVVDAACPFGAYDRGAISQLSSLGYRRLFTSDGFGVVGPTWLTPRLSITRKTDLGRLGSILEPTFSDLALDSWKRLKAAWKRRT